MSSTWMRLNTCPGLTIRRAVPAAKLRERVAAGAVDAGEAEDVDGLAGAGAELEPGLLGREPLARAGARPGAAACPRRRSRRHGRHRRRPSTGSRSRRAAARRRSRRRNAGASGRPPRPAGSRPGARRRRSRRVRFPGPRSRRRRRKGSMPSAAQRRRFFGRGDRASDCLEPVAIAPHEMRRAVAEAEGEQVHGSVAGACFEARSARTSA